MAVKAKKNRKSLYIILALLAMVAIFIIAMVFQKDHSEETNLTDEKPEAQTVLPTQPDEEALIPDENTEAVRLYAKVCQYIDQGDAKSAVTALLEDQASEEVYARLHTESPELLESILTEAVCFYNEDGELFNFVSLRLKGFFPDELFGRYWERIGTNIPKAIADKTEQSAYDVYLFHELLRWYERGDYAIAEIVDLRYLGMIEDVLYNALVEAWEMDPMDDVDPESYIPHYGMRLTEKEKEQIRTWRIYVDEGDSRGAAEMILNGEITENVYRWMQKNDANLVDMLHAQAMLEFAAEGNHEQNMRLILGGFVSDACFERYWDRLEFVPAGYERSHDNYQNADMYFVYEVERICAMENDPSLVQWLWEENLIDEYTFDLLVNRVGGWESDQLETQNG